MPHNVLDYGAVSGEGLCTKPIQDAIDACFLQGGGEVIVPSGRFLTGGLRLRSNVTLHLMENAVLLGSADPEDYTDYINDSLEPVSEEDRARPAPSAVKGKTMGDSVRPYSRWNNAVLRAIHGKNIKIIGERGSEINGQNCFDPLGEEDYRGPHAINFWYCENVTLQGYTVRDSANWAHAIQNSKNISARNLTVLGGHDGFDVRTCDDVTVEDCVFRTGDDCIAGFDNINVTVRNCSFESACSMLRLGGTNVLVENCTGNAPTAYAFRGSLSDEEKKNRAATNDTHRKNCLNVFLYYCDYRAAIRRTPGNVRIRNCRFSGADAIMRLPFGHIWCCNRSLNDISFENCVFEGICLPMRLNCPPEEPLTLRVNHCTVSPRKGYEDIDLITGENVKTVDLTGTEWCGFQSETIRIQPDPEIIRA